MITERKGAASYNLDKVTAEQGYFMRRGEGKAISNDIETRIKQQKQQFFTLLTTQLKNQDPTQPFNTHEMTQNIFTMNMVEQQMETNRNLEKVVTSVEKSRFLESASYVGKKIVYEGEKTKLTQGRGEFDFEIKGKPAKAEIIIYDKFNIEKGRQVVKANPGLNKQALDFSDKKIPDGVYSFVVVAMDEEGQPLPVKKYAIGSIQGVVMDGDNFLFEVNDDAVPMSKVIKMQDDIEKLAERMGIAPAKAKVENDGSLEYEDDEVEHEPGIQKTVSEMVAKPYSPLSDPRFGKAMPRLEQSLNSFSKAANLLGSIGN